MCLYVCKHTLGRVRNYSIREFFRTLIFHSSLVGFPQSVYYNAIVWQSLNSHQLSPWLQACMQLAWSPKQGTLLFVRAKPTAKIPSTKSHTLHLPLFPFCSLSQNLTCINSWKSSSSRVGSVSFHKQFNLLCWQAESTCTQGFRKNTRILPQSATNEFIEQYTNACSVMNHRLTCWNAAWCETNAAGICSSLTLPGPGKSQVNLQLKYTSR